MNDIVNNPPHYVEGRKFQPADVISDWKLNFDLGNAVKYISRAGRKDKSREIEDLQKAIWYINHHINTLQDSSIKKDDITTTTAFQRHDYAKYLNK